MYKNIIKISVKMFAIMNENFHYHFDQTINPIICGRVAAVIRV